jgi:putative transposase
LGVNAACEGFFGRLKTELLYPRNWEDTTIVQFIQVVDSYIRWYNEKRIKISLGSMSPIEYRETLGYEVKINPRFAPHPLPPLLQLLARI